MTYEEADAYPSPIERVVEEVLALPTPRERIERVRELLTWKTGLSAPPLPIQWERNLRLVEHLRKKGFYE